MKPRNNFFSYVNSDISQYKLFLYKLRSELSEGLSVEELNTLYQHDDLGKKKDPTAQINIDTPAHLSHLEPVSDTLATMEKLPTEDKLVISLKKPLKVLFKTKEESKEPQQEEQVTEAYDFLVAAPPLDLSSDTNAAIKQGIKSPILESSGPENIQKVEDDIDGLSVVGINNDIGISLL